ncbi:adventurous-gliding motility protein Z [Toxorhynchites rutilus septentrionalis]|uniref:adventurous-gliding motility protein Z n=1 Tax=Toxorhynchites rutilus septentrionalis TaxID=329112 RepID=UPI00247AF1DC|nr:adventurous-gliding motility protein Z [Toxorhynchites rutilus septentrionalis]XP_055639807.1 adventurous-gliding motility protein Z [Toxorhynchites rutilus septentrionalis]XP_055639808.1 adventurous-gliding motility protein Z [Toxorhynchites rutilus septentrionalis]
MASKSFILVISVLCLVSSAVFAQQRVDVTNQEIRDAILSLVHSYSQLDNKLERHEQRERSLGEQVKKGLITLQKNQRVFDTLKGTITRLDERVSSIETALLSQDEKNTMQQMKLGETLEGVLRWLTDNAHALEARVQPEPPRSEEEGEGLGAKIEELTESIRELRREMAELKSDRDSIEQTNRNLLEQTEKLLSAKVDSSGEIIGKIEERLSSYYNNPVVISHSNVDFEEKVIAKLDKIDAVAKESKSVADSLAAQPPALDKEFIHGLVNETLEAIEDMRLEVLTASDKSFSKTATRIKENNEVLQGSVNEILKTLSEEIIDTEAFFSATKKDIGSLKDEIAALSRLEKFLLQTGENVLDAKRGIDYGIHQILREVTEVVKANSKELNATVTKRFDDIGATILDNHNGALTNLSSKIETEISQVWRQIGIMYQEISSSKQALDRLQQQTETYVNGTITTMDSMEGKVSLITGRMSEVDSNLNYLLGRLSLVTQEFNLIKRGLGQALDEIKSSFMEVQNRLKGPGPHKISSAEVEDDLSLAPPAK